MYCLRFIRSQNPIITNYSLCESILSVTHQHSYPEVMLDHHLSWSTHVTNIAKKAIRMLNLVMGYACIVWDPHYQTQVSIFEKVKRCAARWVLSDYSYYSSVTAMLQLLNWLP